MKKVLTTILVIIFAGLLTSGYLIFERYRKNPLQGFPYPYEFQNSATAYTPEAPILIVGDRMGDYLAKFKVDLAAVISKSLAKPIKIESMARPAHGLHRTLHELQSLTQWPQIVIYQGGSEEFSEVKFDDEQTQVIRENFRRYSDDRIETAITLAPWVSRLIYEPMSRVKLEENPKVMNEIPEADYLKRLDTEILLFEQQLIQMVNLSKDRGSLLILVTTPINLEIAPKRVCSFTLTVEIEKEIMDLKALIEKADIKTAYATSSKLIELNAGNAELYFLHGQIAKSMGRFDEATASFLKASSFDCEPWRATEVHNSIIRKVAKAHQVMLFDFSRFVQTDWAQNTVFFDEIFAQNLYYEKGVEQLGLVIKEILKL